MQLCSTPRFIYVFLPIAFVGTFEALVKVHSLLKGIVMLRWAVIFLVIALVAAVLGFGGIAGSAAGIAKIIFFVFLVLLVISVVMGRRKV